MKHFRAFYNGLNYFADIAPSTLVDGVVLTIYCRNWKGERMIEFDKAYKTVEGAMRGMKTHYPDAKWEEV